MKKITKLIYVLTLGVMALAATPANAQEEKLTLDNVVNYYNVQKRDYGLSHDKVIGMIKKRVENDLKDVLSKKDIKNVVQQMIDKISAQGNDSTTVNPAKGEEKKDAVKTDDKKPVEEVKKPEVVKVDTPKVENKAEDTNKGNEIGTSNVIGKPSSSAPKTVTFAFVDHNVVDTRNKSMSSNLVAQLEKNISKLLTAMASASTDATTVDCGNIAITDDGKADADNYIKRFGIEFNKAQYSAHAINDADGFQVRGIGVTLHPKKSGFEGNPNRKLIICFTSDGSISEISTELEDNMSYDKEEFEQIEDQECLNTIKKFVENFRQYYEAGDIEKVRSIYSDNALIITGKVIKVAERRGDTGKMTMSKKVVYTKQQVKDYLIKLERIFKNSYVNIKFDDIRIERCTVKGKTDYYAVSLKQTWATKSYADEGYLFLLWHFDKEGNNPPKVYVRTWQPLEVGESGRYNIYDCKF